MFEITKSNIRRFERSADGSSRSLSDGSHSLSDSSVAGSSVADVLSARVSGKPNGEAIGRDAWIIGIDPGHSGALAAIDPVQCRLAILDMPVRIFGATANRREVEAEKIVNWLKKHPPDIFYLEEVWGMISDGGVNGFAFGDSYGTIRGIAAGMGVRVVKVRPGVWKANLGATANKSLSRDRAIKLFPSAAGAFKRKMDDGRAEAALIALYGVLDNGIALKKAIEYDSEVG